MLERNGCTVIGPAASCAAALALIGTDLPDAAVLDVQVRGGTTEPVADALLRQGCPFVVVTAYQRRHLPGIMKAAPLLRKPIDEDRLWLELSGLLAG